MFEIQPGRALAFAVSSGCVRDYPIDLVSFLRHRNLEATQVGLFLTEDYSLSKIIRMEFLNSVNLLECGITETLRKGLSGLRMPLDLQRLDRLLCSLADVWWRQQVRAGRGKSSGKNAETRLTDKENSEEIAQEEDGQELRGEELKQTLSSSNQLRQVLFSSVLLHWNLHAPLPRSQRMTLESWMAMIQSGSSEDCPTHLLKPIYHTLAKGPVEAITLDERVVPTKTTQIDLPESDSSELYKKAFASKGILGIANLTSIFSSSCSVEGWVKVSGSSLPTHLGGFGAMAASDCLQMAGMLSEASFASQKLPRRVNSRPVREGTLTVHSPSKPSVTHPQGILSDGVTNEAHRKRDQDADQDIWLCLCGRLLFFFAAPARNSSPFAFIHLKPVQIAEIDPGRSMFTLERGSRSKANKENPSASFQLVLLLGDGRFQDYSVRRLACEVRDPQKLSSWVRSFTKLAQEDGGRPLLTI
eukprot:TRINITY_DN18094_c0_g1_i2.p1 TRINITY_DN18094_c0_g1~~TRINITY_DN18094_c0_g1_i2.p1  ORF type:complete len:472 (+),score=75.97 TRINITY_DN18094_c0_g1_i2:501-1916(+)